MDLLETTQNQHSWPLPAAMEAIQKEGRGALLLLNAAESPESLLAGALLRREALSPRETAHDAALRTYGVGAQILRDLDIARLKVLGNPRRFPSMGGFDLQAEAFMAYGAPA
jgi:3,4-dihydroxy 2-butanone 4-phosphate synthase/GTP cyclohydrolase II